MNLGLKKIAELLNHKSSRKMRRITVVILAAILLITLTVGGTVAWVSTNTSPLINIFTPSQVSCEVTENFDGSVKKNVNVKNTSNIEAYIRVKLVSYRTNDEGQHIGGTAALPSFTPGSNWVEYGGYYYYTLPVAAGGQPATDLISTMTLTSDYTDADGGHQSVDVLAEAIQSEPSTAVQEAWGVTISGGSVAAYGN